MNKISLVRNISFGVIAVVIATSAYFAASIYGENTVPKGVLVGKAPVQLGIINASVDKGRLIPRGDTIQFVRHVEGKGKVPMRQKYEFIFKDGCCGNVTATTINTIYGPSFNTKTESVEFLPIRLKDIPKGTNAIRFSIEQYQTRNGVTDWYPALATTFDL